MSLAAFPYRCAVGGLVTLTPAVALAAVVLLLLVTWMGRSTEADLALPWAGVGLGLAALGGVLWLLMGGGGFFRAA